MQAGSTLDSVNLPLRRESTKVSVERPAGVGLQPGQKAWEGILLPGAGRCDEENAGMALRAGKRRIALSVFGAEIPGEKRYI
ncbi:hypothetical protein MPLB_1140022 [Mesorhizobium sp. ORS 3324]|nr:hypothetical protein MPLB_1140022 [Mesorhizobium sp. ORS 3324]